MTSGHERVHFVGLREFNQALRRVDSTFPRRMSAAMRDAAKTVESRARAEYRRSFAQGTSGRRTRTVTGIAAFASGTRAGVKIGSETRPWMAGQEFGSNRYAQFSPWSGPGTGGGSRGTFLFPVINDEIDGVMERLEDELMAIYRAAMG